MARAINIAPGVVLLRGVLTQDRQGELITTVERFGHLKKPDGRWNFSSFRGRAFKRLDRYPEADRELFETVIGEFREMAEAVDESLRYPPSTHLLTQWYEGRRGLGWHKDDNDRTRGGNNGDDGAPVYSLSLGNTCAFEFILEGDDEERIQEAVLESGDMLVFGGPQRLMKHRVREIYPGTSCNTEARINLTFRTCTDFTSEDEAQYQTEEYVKRVFQKRE